MGFLANLKNKNIEMKLRANVPEEHRMSFMDNAWDTLRMSRFANKSMQWFSSDSKDNFKKTSEQLYDGESFTYDFNSWGYRSDEFEFESDLPALMFNGCSFTMGTGLPFEMTWPYKLKQLLEKEIGSPIKYYNIALGGKSVDYVTRTAFLAKKELPYDFSIYYLPNTARFEWAKDHVSYDVIIQGIDRIFNEKEIPGILSLMNEEYMTMRLLQTVSYIDMLETDYLWNCWAVHDWTRFNDFGGNRFWKTKFNATGTNLDKARDLMHWGPKTNEAFAHNVFEEHGKHIAKVLVKKYEMRIKK